MGTVSSLELAGEVQGASARLVRLLGDCAGQGNSLIPSDTQFSLDGAEILIAHSTVVARIKVHGVCEST